jgi:hypothetical protein
VPVRAVHRLAVAGALLACRTDTGETHAPGQPPEPEPSEIDKAVRSLVADRGVVHRPELVRVVTSWRSDATPRGVMIVVPADTARAEDIADLANKTLDAGFNHALVDAAMQPLAARIDVAAGVVNDKALGYRQWLERGDPRQPVLTVLWVDAPAGAALAALRERPPFMVQAAIVTTRGTAPQRSDLPGDPGTLRVLELPVPHGLDDAAWAEALRFIADVERDVLGR